MSKPEYCHSCSRDFGIFRWRHECPVCENTFCSDCQTAISTFVKDSALGWHEDPCDNCYVNRLKPALENAGSIQTFSSNYAGQVPVDAIKPQETLTSGWCRDRDDSLTALRIEAAFKDYQILFNVQYEQDTESEPGTGKGRHHYSVWRTSGVAGKMAGKKEKGNVPPRKKTPVA